jgi:hypothetical protein
VHNPVTDFKKACDSDRRDVLYSNLTQIGLPIKVVRLIEMCLNETYSKVCIAKQLPHNFVYPKWSKQDDALSPLLFNFALEYAIRKVEGNQVGLKLNGTHPLLAYVDDLNLLRYNIDTINKSTETLIDASKEVSLTASVV